MSRYTTVAVNALYQTFKEVFRNPNGSLCFVVFLFFNSCKMTVFIFLYFTSCKLTVFSYGCN